MSLSKALDWLHGQQREMEALLRELVETSSFTPDKPGVDAVGRAVRAAAPLACEVIPCERYGDLLLFHAGAPAARGGVFLLGHMDTVFPREKFQGFREDGDRLRGPGVLDMKGGIVVTAFALRALEHAGALGSLALSWMLVSEEEVGSPESTPHVRAHCRGARAALDFESGRPGDAIVTARKGTGSMTAHARGRAAHAGNNHREGANAIWSLARFVDRAQQLTDYDRGVTVNVGKVSGGIGKNTVPDRAEAELDLRFCTGSDGRALREALALAARDAALPGTDVELTPGPGRPPMERTPASAALRDAYARCQRDAGLSDGELPMVGGGSDAATTSDEGVPSIDGLGPRGDGYHTLDEYIERATLIPKSEALVRFLLGA